MRQKLNMITLGVADLKKALDFYEKGLGWKRSSASLEDLILFPLGGIVLALYPRQLLAEDALVENTETGFSGITLSYNALSEKEVEEVLEKSKNLGQGSCALPKKRSGAVIMAILKIPMAMSLK